MGEKHKQATSESWKMIYNLQEEDWDFDKGMRMKATMIVHRLVQPRPDQRETSQSSHTPCWRTLENH